MEYSIEPCVSAGSSCGYSKCSDRSKRALALSTVRYFLNITSNFDGEGRSEILSRILRHQELQEIVKKTIFPNQTISEAIVENMKTSLGMVKGVESSDKLAAKRVALHMVANHSGKQQYSDRRFAKALGIQPRNLKKHRADIQAKSFKWVGEGRKRRADCLSEEVVHSVIQFWTSNTRVSPNKKDVCRQRISRKNYKFHPSHYLELTEAEFFMNFKERHPLIAIGFRAFQSLKPFFVKKLKERNTCCCVYHTRIDLLRLAVNSLRIDIHGDACDCLCMVCRPNEEEKCSAYAATFSSVSELWRSTVCPKEESAEWHKLACLLRTCKQCPKPLFCPRELDVANQQLVKWKTFEYVTEDIGRGQIRKRIKQVYKETPAKDIIPVFLQHLNVFIPHNFRSYWQNSQFKECLKNLPDDVVMSVVDFAENYSFKVQNEIQSMHWYSDQCTIMVQICYWKEDGNLKKQSVFYISDDKQHDTLFVQHCFKLHYQHLLSQGLKFTRHWVWSDGAASQFKAARPFYFIARYFSLTNSRMLWNYFGTGHGKGEHDGAGAVVKRALTDEQLDANGAKLQNAQDVVEWLTWKMADDGKQRLFVEVKINDVDRRNAYTCQTVKGTRNTHCVLGFSRKDPTQVLFRSLSCFCSYCVDESWDKCINLSHVQPWKLHKLEPDREENNAVVVEQDDIVYSEQQDQLADMLEVGDHLAVLKSPTNIDSEDYYIVLCKEAKTVLSEQVKDGWGNVFNIGDAVVQGIYYGKLPQCKNSYALLREAPTAMLHADAIVAIKFPMLQAKHKVKGHRTVYRVPLEVHERILGNVSLLNS